ncbi:M1 family metallopeptidase [Robiginitalea biformata]|uniref:M1 family metallopeptidase n=1 Tax=Robiginitalea biformata TaxID=252307 RepID=UPI003B5C4513
MRTRCLPLMLMCFLAMARGQQPGVDFIAGTISILPEASDHSIRGTVHYTFHFAGKADSIYLDAHNMEIHRLTVDGQPATFTANGKELALVAPRDPGQHELRIEYLARPRQTVYFIGPEGDGGDSQIWTQGQGKYSSHWVPSFDDMREKVVFDLEVTAAHGREVIANGVLEEKRNQGDRVTWVYDMEQPMSSYLLAFAIGRYDSIGMQSASGVPIALYYPTGRRADARRTYRHTDRIFNFLEREIGVPYPWQNYKQVPVRDFMYAGMENTGTTFFADSYLVDSIGVNDRNYLNVNAHELAHQWFGNLVTETDGGQHWLHEGFATYYAYLAEGHILGEREMYWALYRSANALKQLSRDGSGESLLDPGSGSLTFYEKGAWALLALRNLVGDTAFREGVRSYLHTYAFGNATVDGFLEVMERAAGTSLDGFRQQWLEGKDFPYEAAISHLRERDASLARYLDLISGEAGSGEGAVAGAGDDHAAAERDNAVQDVAAPGQEVLLNAWEAFDAAPYRAALATRYGALFGPELLEKSRADSRPEVQKALLSIPLPNDPGVQAWLEGLLDAPSYEIREAVLYRLWSGFPDRRAEYLDRTADNPLIQAPNLKQMWWLLALLTEGYADPETGRVYLGNLRGTTGPDFDREVRENGFRLLHQADALGEENLKDLLGATEHHSWQFRKFARRLLDELIAARPERGLWQSLAQGLSRERFKYVYNKIEEL